MTIIERSDMKVFGIDVWSVDGKAALVIRDAAHAHVYLHAGWDESGYWGERYLADRDLSDEEAIKVASEGDVFTDGPLVSRKVKG